MHHLTVIHPFKDYQKGDRVTDEAEIEDILGKEVTRGDGKTYRDHAPFARHVNKTVMPEA